MTSIIGILYGVIGVAGLAMGSFAGATVWRLRARQLVADKTEGEPVDAQELRSLKPLTQASFTTDRSRCLHCHHELRWYDLLPLVSWVSTRGNCRYCHQPIGWFEPLIELATAGLFVAFYYFWTMTHGVSEWPLLVVWLVALTLLVILFAYDAKWFLLPDVITIPLIVIGGVIASVIILQDVNSGSRLISTFGSVAILSGLYLVLYLASRQQWVGFGDVKLGLALGLLLADWQLAFLTLFLANLIGTILVLPGLVTKKLDRKAQVPFGPLLIAGFLITLFFGSSLIEGYIEFSNHLLAVALML